MEQENYGNNNNNSNNSNNNIDSSNFYENYPPDNGGKKKKGTGILAQMLIVAILAAILGGVVTGAFFYFIGPELEAGNEQEIAAGSVTDSGAQGGGGGGLSETGEQEEGAGGANTSVVKTVEIVDKTESLVTVIAEKAGPSVVGIRATPSSTSVSNDFAGYFFGSYGMTPSEGSGIIISKDGYVITNHHVIQNVLDNSGALTAGAKIEIFLPRMIDKPYQASLVGWDKKTDLAVLKIEGDNFDAVEMGDSDGLKIGELAVAIGNPGGIELMGSVTAGVISGINREIQTEDGKELKYIQTDAAINPGNSGGALVNSKGQLIGINTVKIVASGYEGLGFAIPVNTAKEIIDSIINNTYIKGRAPVLGIQSTNQYTEAVAKRYGWPQGVYVVSVTQFTGAHTAGIKENDIITKFQGKEVKTLEDLNVIKNEHKPGDVVDVEVYRIDEEKYYNFKVTLTEDRG